LGDATPTSCYAASPRPYRTALEPLVYPAHYERRLVSRNGGVRWKHRWVNVSHLFAELEIGFEEIDDGLWNVYFGPVWLGRFHEEVGRIVDQLGRPMRHQGDNHKEGTTEKCYPSPEYKVSPVTWTVQAPNRRCDLRDRLLDSWRLEAFRD
jgi:hypothetical protein